MLSIAPFVLAPLRSAVAIDKGLAGAPEHIAWRDRVLQPIGTVWVRLLGLVVSSA